MSIYLCALTSAGEFLAVLLADVATAGLVGNTMVNAGAWKTWDAFDLSVARTLGRRLVASYGESESSAERGSANATSTFAIVRAGTQHFIYASPWLKPWAMICRP